jgi:hypothetical protein
LNNRSRSRDGNFDSLDGLNPILSWSNSAKSGDIDLLYGIETSLATLTSDLASLLRKIWGKESTNLSGWGVSSCAVVDSQARDRANLEIDASNKEKELSNHLVASAGDEFSVNLVKATKGFDQTGACVMVNPRLVINYSNDDTNVKLTVSFIGSLLCSHHHY